PLQVAGAREGRARDWGDQAGLRLPEGALPRTREEPAPTRSQCRAGESVHDAATIAECVGAVSLKDEKCGDRKRKTPNRRAERIASLPVTRNRRRAAFSSQVLQRFLSSQSPRVRGDRDLEGAAAGAFEHASLQVPPRLHRQSALCAALRQ